MRQRRHGLETPPAGRAAAILALLTGALALAGCHTSHYVVLRDRTPLYAAVDSEQVLAELPLYHHEPLDADEQENGRVRLRYRDLEGYAPRGGVRLFSYLDPGLDGGVERDQALQRELREAQLSALGEGWPADTVRAIRAEEVLVGMSRRQVELAWGWPVDVEPGEEPDEERWVYKVRTHEVVRHYLDDPWPTHPWGALPSSYSWQWHPRWANQGWVAIRIPFIEERTVTIGPEGTVTGIRVERTPASAS